MCSTMLLEKRPAFCRFHQDVLIVSTYQLEDNERNGSLHFFTDSLKNDFCLPTEAGVFRFELSSDGRTLIAALTDGSLVEITIEERRQTNKIAASSSDSMLLDVSINDSSLLTSDNSGHLMLLDRTRNTLLKTWEAHQLPYTKEGCEVWTCSFLNEVICSSGGEDSILKIWDFRTGDKVAELKHFQSGVTFVAPSKTNNNMIYTGSYDEHCRIFDLRNFKPYKELKLSGGVWNVEQGEKHLLAACMYGGWALMSSELEIICQDIESGKQLLYGASMREEEVAFVTFNDYRVTLQNINDEK